MNLNIDKIKDSIKYKWLLRLNKNQLLNSNMWISKLFRHALNLKQKVYAEYDYKYDVNLGIKDINLFPENEKEFIDTIKDSNISPYCPYSLISKQPIRNT